jgi:uncharacterized protein (DUF427 family)
VWDYPRPPALDPTSELVLVEFAGRVVARTRRAIRVLETSHPPSYYLPEDDVDRSLLRASTHRTWCEWKGEAVYADLIVGRRRSPLACWWYPSPPPEYAAIAGHISFYPGRVDRCLVDGEQVHGSESDFYGGWITSRVVGPFKGPPGTAGW